MCPTQSMGKTVDGKANHQQHSLQNSAQLWASLPLSLFLTLCKILRTKRIWLGWQYHHPHTKCALLRCAKPVRNRGTPVSDVYTHIHTRTSILEDRWGHREDGWTRWEKGMPRAWHVSNTLECSVWRMRLCVCECVYALHQLYLSMWRNNKSIAIPMSIKTIIKRYDLW